VGFGGDLLFPFGKDWKPMSFGFGEILLVLAIVVFFFGAKRIPQIARGVGEGIRNFKSSVKDGSDDDKQLPGGPDS
jgi:sec-independent protein translocase protein TatA